MRKTRRTLLAWVALGGIISTRATAEPDPPPPPTPIEEITLERVESSFVSQYRVTLRPDGSVRRTGNPGTACQGTFAGHIMVEEFQHLARLIQEIRFDSLEPMYGSFDDAPEATVTVRRAGVVRRVEDSWGSEAPVGLWGLELAIDGLVGRIDDWKPVVPTVP